MQRLEDLVSKGFEITEGVEVSVFVTSQSIPVDLEIGFLNRWRQCLNEFEDLLKLVSYRVSGSI